MIRNFGYILVFFALTLLTACSQSDIEVNPQDVTLDLSVVVNDGGISNNSSTRAFPDTEDGSFEAPANDREKLSTLRVIIVHTVDGKQVVEHNRMVNISKDGYVINDNLRFLVKSGEQKEVYLFGNEKWAGTYNLSTGVWKPIYDFDKLLPGVEFPKNDLEALQIKREKDWPALDNSGSSPGRSGYVPMSEFFSFMIEKPQSEDDRFFPKTLFVTRSLVKFSFNFTVSEDFWQEGAKIAGVRVEGMADNCYYLPNNTVYDPGKDLVSTKPLDGRYITYFEVPSTLTYSNCDLGMKMVNNDFPEIKKGLNLDYFPPIYLPETKHPENGIRVSVLLEGADNQWLTSQPLKISTEGPFTDLPRNTHLKVNVTLKSTTIAPEVVLLPYTGVELNPGFGI